MAVPSQPACKPTRATADDKARPLLSQRFWSLPPAARIFYQRIPPSPVSACFSLTTYLIHSSHLPPPPVSNTHPAAAPPIALYPVVYFCTPLLSPSLSLSLPTHQRPFLIQSTNPPNQLPPRTNRIATSTALQNQLALSCYATCHAA